WHPRGTSTSRIHETAERVDLVVVAGKRHVMSRQRHRLLLRPFVGGRVVLVHDASGLPEWNQPGKNVQLSAGGGAKQLFARLRKGCNVFPCALCKHRRRGKRQQQEDSQ